jgi:hypothetical protein
MSTEFKVVVEGDLSDSTVEAVTAALQKAALLELAGSRDLEALPSEDGAPKGQLIFRSNIRGGKFIMGRTSEV